MFASIETIGLFVIIILTVYIIKAKYTSFTIDIGRLNAQLPMMMMTGNLSLTGIMNIIAMPEIINHILRFASVSDGYTCKIYKKVDQMDADHFIYRVLKFVLTKQNLLCKTKAIKSEACASRDVARTSEFGVQYKYYLALYEPDSGSDVLVDSKQLSGYMGTPFNVTVSSYMDDKITYFLVRATTQEYLKNFLEYLDAHQIEYINHLVPKNNAVYFTFAENKWISNKISVNKTFDNTFLNDDISARIQYDLDFFTKNPEYYKKKGLAYKKGYMLYGDPGNGKSSVIFSVANKYKRPIYRVNLDCNRESLIKQISSIDSGSVVIFEDIDSFSVVHDRSDDSIKNIRKPKCDLLIDDILYILDGYIYLNGCIIFMTTNHIERIDSAVLRPGRIDHKIELKNSNEQIRRILEFYYNDDFPFGELSLDESRKDISIAELINTHIVPNLDNPQYIVDLFSPS